jgi:hypothetical protein
MSGEGHIAGIGAIRERIERHLAEATRPAFDKRPGAIDLALPAPLVCGARGGDGWRVQLALGEARARLTPDAARALARELTEYAALAEGQRW